MTELSLGEALLRDVADASPEQTVRKVKNTAAAELAKLDPTASIRFTEYFNHTFAPDIVMQWPKDGRGAERFVYLRLSDRARELTADVSHIRDQRPVVLSLTSPTRGGVSSTPAEEAEHQGAIEELSSAAQEADTLVSDLGGLSTLATARNSSTFVGLLSATVARGGRGLLTVGSAAAAATSIDAGFMGAQQLNAEAVRLASNTSDSLLSATHASRLNRFLQAVWVGAGGRPDLYPREMSLGGELDDDSWAFLLDLPIIDDLDFWRRLGRSLTVSQLARLNVNDGSENLHNLVKANTDWLWARNCTVVAEEPNLLELELRDQWKWTVRRRALALRGPSFTCYLAELKAGLDQIEGTQSDGVAVPELRERAKGRKITGVVMSAGQEELDLASRVQGDVTNSAWLDLLSSVGGDGPRVKRATALLTTGHTVHVDFTQSAASAATRSQPAIPAFVTGVLPLLRSMDAEAMAAMSSCFWSEGGNDLLSLLGQEDEAEVARRQIKEEEAEAQIVANEEDAYTHDDNP